MGCCAVLVLLLGLLLPDVRFSPSLSCSSFHFTFLKGKKRERDRGEDRNHEDEENGEHEVSSGAVLSGDSY